MADERLTDDEMVLAYVRGRLPVDEANRLGDEAAIRPELAAEIALARGIVGALDEDARLPRPAAPRRAGRTRVIDPEPAPAAARWVWPVQMAAVAAAAVLVWQLALVPFLNSPDSGDQPVAEVPAGGFALAVAFSPGATEAGMRELVRSVGARVTDGPNAVGLWTLTFPDAGARDNGMALLMATPFVESVQVR